MGRNTHRCLLAASLLCLTAGTWAAPYQWNYPAPSRSPSTSTDNGKVVFFDVSHGGTEGNADWVIDGAFSDFADALVAEGYSVREYRGVDKNNDGIIQFVDDYSSPSSSATNANEAVITSAGIAAADVLVLAESNRPFTQAELNALEQFVAAGKGLFFIADHYNADRNLNSWDSTEVYNGYNRSNLSAFNIGGAYGDLRNLGSANAGWLAQTFGLRFRFNAIDLHAGVSGVVGTAQSEGITAGVGPVLMAGGATLAITDASKAKGLVYFSASDSPSRWNHAVDAGLYYGGTAEGPYVAIAKTGAGKAAFIGDSSPIEDATPKYRRQDSGSTKTTYPGWTDPGNAAQLAINIIDWLATPEGYTHFNTAAHPPGTATPSPMAAVEQNDPDNGEPWSTPSAGYDPWDPSTFAHDAYGAASGTGGGASAAEAIGVSEALSLGSGSAVKVNGIITQAINGTYALELADAHNAAATLYVKLESHHRDAFSPENDSSLIGKTLIVSGTRDTYMGHPSLESVTHLELANSDANSPAQCGAGDSVSVATANNSAIGASLVVVGEVIGAVNDVYALELADLDAEESVYVKLEPSQRDYFSPINNPTIVGQVLQVTAVRDTYMSHSSLESVSDIQQLYCP